MYGTQPVHSESTYYGVVLSENRLGAEQTFLDERETAPKVVDTTSVYCFGSASTTSRADL